MIKHLIFIKFKQNTSNEQIAELEKALSFLPGCIAEIKEYSFGRDIMGSERSFDFALVSSFEDVAALGRYNEHPEHQKVLSIARNIAERTIAVDYAFSGSL